MKQLGVTLQTVSLMPVTHSCPSMLLYGVYAHSALPLSPLAMAVIVPQSYLAASLPEPCCLPLSVATLHQVHLNLGQKL